MTSTTSTGCAGVVTDTESQPVITAITLPNGTSYQFSYDPTYGELSQIKYPSGGYVSYTWGLNPQSAQIFYQVSSTNHCNTIYDKPAVLHRYVSFDGSTVALQQDFSYSTTWGGGGYVWTKQTIVTTHDLIRGTSYQTIYNYVPSWGVGEPAPPNDFSPNDSPIPTEQTITYKSESGSVLKTVTKGWFDQFELACELVTLDNGQIAGTFYAYGPGAQETDKKEYDYGLITSTSACPAQWTVSTQYPTVTPTRETITTYQNFANTPIYTNGPSIFDRPSSVITYANGVRAAETDFSYDQTAVSAVSPAPTGHDEANYAVGSTAPRGNATTTTRQCFQGSTACTNSVSTLTFDETGQILSRTDPCGNATCSDLTGSNHTTSYSYADNFDSPPAGNTNAYPTQITDALGHTTKLKYAYSDGQPISSTDQNNLITSYVYADSLRRLTETDRPDGGKTTISYNDSSPSPTVTTTKQINSSQSAISVSVSDGLGHIKQTQLASDPQGTVYADTTFDGLGRVWKQSNPYRSGTDATTSSGTTIFAYDSLGRKLTQTYPDNSALTTAYCGPNTLVTDPTMRWRRSRTDALGRLVEVDEPNAVSALVSACPGQSDPIWVTSYGYDALSNLTSVLQNGSRPRSFSYDSLSRLLSSNNPETGTVTYTYDANSNVSTKKDARNITITYGYDVLNREKSVSYSNGEGGIATNYDESNCLGLASCQNVGQKTSMTDQSGSEAWSYQVDSGNRRSVHVNQRTTNSETRTSTYYLDLAGNITQMVYPSGRTVNYAYDNANRPKSATDAVNGLTYATGFQTPPTGTACTSSGVCYTPQGTPYAMSIGQSATFTGLNLLETANVRLQPNEIKATSTGGNAFDLIYSYTDPVSGHNAGHVYGITNNLDSSRSQQFTYDQLNRISSATASTYAVSPSHCWGENYGIDPWGNPTSITPMSTSAYAGCVQESGFSCGVDANNHMLGCYGQGYDAAGNMGGDGAYNYSWNAESQIVYTSGNSHYSYDGAGRRVAKPDGNEPKLYWYGSGGEILTETNPSSLEILDYVYFAGKRVAQVAGDLNLNGGFESGLTNWSVSGPGTATAVNNPANAHSGSYYAEVTSPPNSTTTITTTQLISAQKGETITATGWVYRESGGAGGNFYSRLTLSVVGDGGQCNLAAQPPDNFTMNTWINNTLAINIPSWCQGPYTVTVNASVWNTSPTQSASARFDDITLNGNTVFFAEDSLGTSRVLTDVNGVVCYDADFYPFGGERSYTNNCTTHYKFEGKERDVETGNDYFGARYYSNRFGRWLSADWSAVPVAVPYANLTNPQTLNLYAMVSDDPESFADLDGHGVACDNPTSGGPCAGHEPGILRHSPLSSGNWDTALDNLAEDAAAEQQNRQAQNQQTPQSLAAQVSPEAKAAIMNALNASNSPTADDKKGGFHEESVKWGTDASGNVVVSPSVPGAYAPPGTNPHTDFTPANPATDQKLVTVGGFAHIHPKGGGDRSFVQGSSGADLKFAGMSSGPINLVVGAADKKVYFYNGSGVIGKPMKLKDFMGNQ